MSSLDDPPPAAISPADVNYMETLNTLRFASQTKNIVNSPTVNDNGSMKVMRELPAYAHIHRRHKHLIVFLVQSLFCRLYCCLAVTLGWA